MPKILMVDDDVELAEMVKSKLEAEGYQTLTLHTGKGAFEYAKKVKPDIAILDIMLPGVTGYQICRRIRKDPELYRTAILIMTALGEEPEVLHGLEQGADDYLTKPFKLHTLMSKLEALEGLLDAIGKRHSVTQLPGTEAVKREIDLRLVRGTPMAAIYVDVKQFKAYSAARGTDGQQKAMTFTANTLTTVARTMGVYESFVAHLGGAHYVVVVNLEDYERYCTELLDAFDRQVHDLYTQQEIDQGYIVTKDRHQQTVKCPFMALSVGVAHTQFRKFKSAKRIFEVLAQTAQMARPDGKSAMFVDRRHSDR